MHAVYGQMGAHMAVVHTCLCALALHIGNTTGVVHTCPAAHAYVH
jgi:hypothetical protein